MITASKRRASGSLASRSSSAQPARSSRLPASWSVKSQTTSPPSSAAFATHASRWEGKESVGSCLSLVESRPHQAKRRPRRAVGWDRLSVFIAIVSLAIQGPLPFLGRVGGEEVEDRLRLLASELIVQGR